MVLAYLRGLLTPDYPQGLQSILRERMVLDALAMEQTATMLLDRVMVEAAFAPLYSGPQQVIRSLFKEIDRISSYREFDVSADKAPVMSDETRAFVKLYHALHAAGILEPETDE